MALRSAILAAMISIGLWFCLSSNSYMYKIFSFFTYATSLFKTENLRNSTVPFLTSLIPGLRDTWYSNILSIVFWCQLVSFGIRFINIQCAAGRKCCSTARFCKRCMLSGAGLLTMVVLHSCYGSTFLGLWFALMLVTLSVVMAVYVAMLFVCTCGRSKQQQ